MILLGIDLSHGLRNGAFKMNKVVRKSIAMSWAPKLQ